MANTARLNLDLIAANQAQKHVPANEAYTKLDTLVMPTVLDKDFTAPPGSPTEGDCYIVGTSATGDWTGNDKAVARYEDGAWRFFTPASGWLTWVQDESAMYVYSGSDWTAAFGSAAYKDIGTSGDVVPKLDTAHTWTAAQTFDGGSTPLSLKRTDNTAAVGPYLDLFRESNAATAGHNLGMVRFRGRDGSGGSAIYGDVLGVIADATVGSVKGKFQMRTAVSGTVASRMSVESGVVVGSPTGGDQGSGTINASALYDDGVAVCPALRSEFLESGTVDLDFWDATVPDIEIPETVEDVPVYEDAEETVEDLMEDTDGSLIRKTMVKTVRRPVEEFWPIYDEDGNGLDAVLRPVTERRVTPAQTITRRHEIAHLFKRMLDDGFDPREPRQYIAKLTADQALPGMPKVDEFTTGPKISLTEKFERLWLALEMLALVVISQEKRITVLEDRLGKQI